MPNRPRPQPSPQAFDVFRPGKGKPSPTSRPVIVSQQPKVQDSTLVEEHGSPVPNAHHAKQPLLRSLPPRRVAPAAHAMHHSAEPAPSPTPTPEATEPAAVPTKKISHTGHIIARPSGAAATRHATLLHHKVSPPRERAKPVEPEASAEPSLAAVPITPVEQPAGLANAKTEGKEELLAAMPVEIRRSVANATGQSAADWDMPPEVAAQAAPATAAEPAPSPAGAAPANPAPAEQAPAPQATTESAQPAAPAATQSAQVEQPTEEAAIPLIKTDRKRSSDAIVFIIMLVLFLGLGTVVAMLFITGTIAL